MNSPEEGYYLSEIGRFLGKAPGVFQKAINSIEKQGFLRSYKRGNQRVYKINRTHPLFFEVERIVQKTEGIEGLLKEAVEKIKDIKIALIFGSYAKDDIRPNSDIDLLVVGTQGKTEEKVLKATTEIEEKINREVNFTIYSGKEFKQKLKDKNPFLMEVLSDKYILIKGRDDKI